MYLEKEVHAIKAIEDLKSKLRERGLLSNTDDADLQSDQIFRALDVKKVRITVYMIVVAAGVCGV